MGTHTVFDKLMHMTQHIWVLSISLDPLSGNAICFLSPDRSPTAVGPEKSRLLSACKVLGTHTQERADALAPGPASPPAGPSPVPSRLSHPPPISELAALPGLLSVLPSTCQGLAQGHCGNSILGCLAAAAPTATTLSAAGFLFHSLLFLGILCSIKPFACNTAGSPPSHPLLRSFLLLPPLLAPWASPCLPFLPAASPQTSVGVEPPGLSHSSLSPAWAEMCREGASIPTS